MNALPLPALVVLALVAASGALLLARFASGNATRTWSLAAGRQAAMLAVLAAVLIAVWLGGVALALLFAALSAWTLHGMLALDAPRSSGDRAPRLACYACVPLQYGLLLVGATDAFVLTLPLVATLGLPLATVLAGDVRALGERLAVRFLAVLLSVYALSFAAALVWVDRASAGHAPVAGVVVAALAGGATFDALRQQTRRRGAWRSPRAAGAIALTAVATLAAAAGVAAAPLVEMAPVQAVPICTAAAVLGALGTAVVAAMARGRPGSPPYCGLPARLEAVAFAAPLVFFALR